MSVTVSSTFLVRNLSPRAQRALPLIAAAYNMRSSNEVVLAAVEAMIDTLCERDPIIASAIKLAAGNHGLPERTAVAA